MNYNKLKVKQTLIIFIKTRKGNVKALEINIIDKE